MGIRCCLGQFEAFLQSLVEMRRVMRLFACYRGHGRLVCFHPLDLGNRSAGTVWQGFGDGEESWRETETQERLRHCGRHEHGDQNEEGSGEGTHGSLWLQQALG